MIVEKPAWLRHAGLQIFSMDVQPGGQRCATAGGDHKVRIWSTKPFSKDGDLDMATPKLLATLCDHFGSVNCVRWSKSGLYIASGSDDNLVQIHEKRPGTGTVEFGSGEPPNIENWKVVSSLRGHTADVVDLAWSPDDSMLATCSLDNTVRIWQMPGGSSLAVLTGHSSLVKGVAWDPIGSFLASQSDDKTVMIWQTSNWTSVHRAEGPWGKSVGSTFFRRLAWSPCGHFIITTHGFQKPSHTAQVLERGDWSASFNFVGHNAPVVAVRFNHSMFRKRPLPPDHEQDADPKKVPKELLPYNVIAIGSQDCNVTVWSTANPRPVFVGKHFFNQSVVDLTWSPDGYSLSCCSLDGTVATFHFEAKELGHIISEKEMEEFKKSRYGDLRGRQGCLAESPAQLLVEAAAAAKKALSSIQPKEPAANANATLAVVKAPDLAIEDTTSRSLPAPPPASVKPQPPAPSPVKQKEYRQQDGRRRITPEPLPSEEGPPNGNKRDDKARSNADKDVGEKRKLPAECTKGDLPPKRPSNGVIDDRIGGPARASTGNYLTLEAGRGLNITAIDVTRAADLRGADGVLSVQVRMPDEVSADMAAPMCLEAKPVKLSDGGGGAARVDSGETDIICSQGGEIRWRDRFTGKVTALTGNTNIWAVGCEDGSLQVYTMAGRRAFPSMLVGSAAAFMDCNRNWQLLLLTRGGTMHVWDLLQATCVLNESLLPLISSSSGSSAKESGIMKIISARFSQAGAPLVVLANGHAFLFHMKMRSWLRIADDAFPASSFVSTWPSAQASSDGELAALQKGAASLSRTSFAWNRALVNEKYQTRGHLEDQMAAALALKSADEYRRHLVAYTRFLAREADEVRLRELCEDLLGPLHVPDNSDLCEKQSSQWDPYVIGMKKREVLRTEVLPAMASNRAVQRLLNEFLDLLSEYEMSQPSSQPASQEHQQEQQEHQEEHQRQQHQQQHQQRQ